MVQYVLSRILFVNLKLALNSLECVASCTPIILLAEDDLERRCGMVWRGVELALHLW